MLNSFSRIRKLNVLNEQRSLVNVQHHLLDFEYTDFVKRSKFKVTTIFESSTIKEKLALTFTVI